MKDNTSTDRTDELRVLSLLAPSRDSASIPRVLASLGTVSVLCSTREELCFEIGKGAGAVLIEEEVVASGLAGCLRSLLESQPSWSELPIIVLLRRGIETRAAREAQLLPGDITLVERPVRVSTLMTVIRSALGSRRRQYLVRDQLQALTETAENLRVTETELRKAKTELETRVLERTGELSRALEELRIETKRRIDAVNELREKELQLIQQSRMAAMGEMIGFIAHQWRQPLNILGLIIQSISLSYSGGVLTPQEMDANTAKGMELIGSMSRTIDDFRNFFKTERKKTFFKVSEVLEKTVKLVEPGFKETRLSIAVSVEDDVVVEGYPNEYSQVILNILLNARDACRDRGVSEPRILIRVKRENATSRVTIADNAGGIPEEILAKIFEPYFTTKGPEKGTGIGLYMAKIIVEKNMGGRLAVRNTGDGAEFEIEI